MKLKEMECVLDRMDKSSLTITITKEGTFKVNKKTWLKKIIINIKKYYNW